MSEETTNISKSPGVSGNDVAVGTTSSLYYEEDANAAPRPPDGWQVTARSTEDFAKEQPVPHTKGWEHEVLEREQMFVIVDASCDSDPSSRELLVTEKKNVKAESNTGKKHFNKHVIPRDLPSTSKDITSDFFPSPHVQSDSREEMLIDINLQSDNEIKVNDKATESHSLVVSYIKNKEAVTDSDGTLMSSKKKPSLLESIPKLETILEGQQFPMNKGPTIKSESKIINTPGNKDTFSEDDKC